jgi:N-acetylneuraminic acid mutarotase
LVWHQEASNPLQREEAQSLVYNGKLYEVGGYLDGFQATTEIDAADPNTGKWSRVGDMPYAITHAAVAADPDGHDFWFIGGFLGSFKQNPERAPLGTAVVMKYDAAANTWSMGPTLPTPRGAGGAGIVNHKLYFFGGSNKQRTKDLPQGYVLNLKNPAAGWKRIADMPNARNHLGGVAVNGVIYAIGGQHHLEDQSIMQNEVDQYNPATNTWMRVASLPVALSHFNAATVVYNRYIITVGGENPHNVAKPFVFAYDTTSNLWARLTDLPGPRRAGVAGVIGNLLIQSTGYDHAVGETATTYAADLSNVFT